MITVRDGNNSIIVDPGANYHLSAEMIKENEGIIKTGGIMLTQLEIPIEAVEEAVRIAKANHVIVLLNPAPARELSDGLLSKIDIITPNETECEAITGIKISGPDDAQKAVLQLMGNRLTCSLYYYIRLMSNNMACPFGQA
jgi:ribokinase